MQISSTNAATEAGMDSVKRAYNAAEDIKNQFENVVIKLSEMNKNFDSFIKAQGASPSEIRHVANEVSCLCTKKIILHKLYFAFFSTLHHISQLFTF